MSTTPDLESMQKEINDLKRQNKLLKQKNSDKMMVQSKKSLDSIHQKKPSTELPSIAKPIVLNLSKEIFNGYKSNIRDLIEASTKSIGSNSSISVEDNDREGNSTTEILSEVAISGRKSPF
ncbi:unnamed protein product [Rhizophagus irregularis]|nr:unnamed protein product [Rhizophagus irregularis]